MLIEQAANNGYHPVMVVGDVTADPIFNVTPTGKHHCTFYVRYGNTKDEKGKNIARSFLCEAWNKWADNCGCFEKGDSVAIFGIKSVDDYRSKKSGKKEFKVVVEFAVNAGALYDATNVNNENTSVSEDEEQADDSPSGFFA